LPARSCGVDRRIPIDRPHRAGCAALVFHTHGTRRPRPRCWHADHRVGPPRRRLIDSVRGVGAAMRSATAIGWRRACADRASRADLRCGSRRSRGGRRQAAWRSACSSQPRFRRSARRIRRTAVKDSRDSTPACRDLGGPRIRRPVGSALSSWRPDVRRLRQCPRPRR